MNRLFQIRLSTGKCCKSILRRLQRHGIPYWQLDMALPSLTSMAEVVVGEPIQACALPSVRVSVLDATKRRVEKAERRLMILSPTDSRPPTPPQLPNILLSDLETITQSSPIPLDIVLFSTCASPSQRIPIGRTSTISTRQFTASPLARSALSLSLSCNTTTCRSVEDQNRCRGS